MKILVIDGQGGKMGAALTDRTWKSLPWARTALPQAPCCAPVRTLPPQAKTPLW